MSAVHTNPGGCDTPSEDEELHTYGSPSLVGTVPPHLVTTGGTLAAQKPDSDLCCEAQKPGMGLLKKKLIPALKRYNPTLTLENAGSVARDHLASERTFLAYVRTSLTIASTGVALVQLFTISAATTNKAIEGYSRPLGAVIIGIGIATLLFGMVRYFTIQSALIHGNYPVARVSTILLALVLGAVIIVVFGVIVGVRGKS